MRKKAEVRCGLEKSPPLYTTVLFSLFPGFHLAAEEKAIAFKGGNALYFHYCAPLTHFDTSTSC